LCLAKHPTRREIKTLYKGSNDKCPNELNVELEICGEGTTWKGNKCVIDTSLHFQKAYHLNQHIKMGGNTWHTCTCMDGTNYECKSNKGDGDACCGRSMPVICGEDNVSDGGNSPALIDAIFDTRAFELFPFKDKIFELVPDKSGSAWHTCTCKDGSTYECKSNKGDGAACCGRSMPAICGEDNVSGDISLDTQVPIVFADIIGGNNWHTCTCKDGSTYECKSNKGDGAACCGRSMPAICGEDNVPNDQPPRTDVLTKIVGQKGSTWHTCTCKDGSTYECQSNKGDGDACCTRSMPAICGDC
jgi:hypothetical protein